MKKIFRVLLIISVVLLLILVIGKVVMAYMLRDVYTIPVATPNLSNLEDGKYIGEYSIKPVYAKVEVTIEDEKITHIQLLQHDQGLGSEAEAILDDVIAEQSLEVDAISGATVSSKCILKAIEDALEP